MYEDSYPERRNLIVTSLGFIAFSFADGELKDGVVQLGVINAKFNHPDFLIILVWIIFAWFIYRYWLASRGKFKNEFKQEFLKYAQKKYLVKYVNAIENNKEIADNEDGYRAFTAWWQGWRIWLEIKFTGKVSRNSDGYILSYEYPNSTKPEKNISIHGIRGWTWGLLATFQCMFNNQSFSAHLVPYILALIAALGGIIRLFS